MNEYKTITYNAGVVTADVIDGESANGWAVYLIFNLGDFGQNSSSRHFAITYVRFK